MATTSCPSDCVMLSRWASRSTTKSDALTVTSMATLRPANARKIRLVRLRKHRLAAYSAAAGGWAATAVPRGGGTSR
jgi:hypothetical protein